MLYYLELKHCVTPRSFIIKTGTDKSVRISNVFSYHMLTETQKFLHVLFQFSFMSVNYCGNAFLLFFFSLKGSCVFVIS